ncbi:twin transmembrane helix small protein [Methylocaldum sp.]|uniref:twin transmembrane helix small protein n=1 Tax=Methylocaldum sp. TaxID=1969727 RepID=UPI002D49F5A7|nr:twin transmembrane helix small protein [Methylocaldum sp.]HYE36188.1 twin transmembrane helix small protein [Methylocaldum sp.]
MPFVKALIILFLLIIIGSLGTALVYLVKDRTRSPRTVKALTVRIGLSIGLFIILLLAYRLGLLHPHGLPTGRTPPPAENKGQSDGLRQPP